MDITMDVNQIRNVYRSYWTNPEEYTDIMLFIENQYDCISAILNYMGEEGDDFRYFLSMRLRTLIHEADVRHLTSALSLIVSSTSPIIDPSIYYSILNAIPICSLVEVYSISYGFSNWLKEKINSQPVSCAELATILKGLIITPPDFQVNTEPLLQSLVNAFTSTEIVSNIGVAFSIWISHSSFKRLINPKISDLNEINNLLIICNYLYVGRFLDAEFTYERQIIRELITPVINLLISTPKFDELIINMLYFIVYYTIPIESEDFFRLLLRLPYQTAEDIEIYGSFIGRLDCLAGDSCLTNDIRVRLSSIAYNLIDIIRTSGDMDLIDILYQISYGLCRILLMWDMESETILRPLLTIMYEGYYEITRIIFTTIYITRLKTDNWLDVAVKMGMDRTLLIDRIEDAVYGFSDLLETLYEYRDRPLQDAVGDIDPISCEPLGSDKVQLPDTGVIINRTTLERWFNYAGYIDPYTRKQITWDDVYSIPN